MQKTLRTTLRLILFFAFGFMLLWLLYHNHQKAYAADCLLKGISISDCSLLDKLQADFAELNYLWIWCALVCYGLSNLSRAIRWKMLLLPMGYNPRLRNAFFTTIVGYLSNLALPRFGEVARAGSLARYEGIPIEKAVGTIVVDRVADLFMILGITVLGLAIEFENIAALARKYIRPGERFGNQTIILLSLGAALAVFLGWWFRRRLSRLAIFQTLSHLADGFLSGLRSIRNIRSKSRFLLHTLLIWLMYFLMTYMTLLSFHVTANLTLSAALVVFILGAWGIVVPSPGGMGTYHFMTQVGLAVYGIGLDDGFSWANISFFTMQIGGTLLYGAFSLACLPLLNRGYQPAAPVAYGLPERG